MTAMVAELYTALRDAGASEEKSVKAAEAVASLDPRFNKIESDLAVLKFMVGVVIAGIISIIVKSFFVV